MKKNKHQNSSKHPKKPVVVPSTPLSSPDLSAKDQSDSPGLSHVARGILIGGALGVFAALFGLSDSMPRAIAVGGVAGLLAGLTLAKRHRKRQ